MLDSLIRKIAAGDEEYLRDESKKTGSAESISFPKTHEQLCAIMKQMQETGTPVTVQGNRTGLAAAAVPSEGHVLNLTGMDKVLGMRREGDRFFLRVQPGVILQKMNKSIAARLFDTTDWDEASLEAYMAFTKAPVQMFTPDPTENTASIGGMAACNASGACSYHYGPTRNHISALRCVLADGQSLSLKRGQVFAQGRTLCLTTEEGGKLEVTLPGYRMPDCKNASGYYCKENMDAIDLLIGSDGTLAVISELELCLLPKPKLVWGATCFFATQEQAVQFTTAMKKKPDGVVALEYFDAWALNILRRQKAESQAFARLPKIQDDYGCAIYSELHRDTEEQIYADLEDILACSAAAGGNPDHTWVACTESDLNLLHFFRHAVPESVNMLVERYKRTYPGITKIGGDLAVPDDKFREQLAIYDRTLEQEGLDHAGWGHIGDNHIHVNILPRNMEEYHRGKELLAGWAAETSRMGGAVSAEHGVGKLKAPFLEVMYGKQYIEEMADLKEAFDPKWILGRGNLFAPRQKEETK